MTPAMLMPDPKMYWSAVPRGQMPPPTVDDPVAQIEPSEATRHCTRLGTNTVMAVEKSRNPLPGFGLATATDDAATLSVNAANATRIRLR
jgi:hypothetical protein